MALQVTIFLEIVMLRAIICSMILSTVGLEPLEAQHDCNAIYHDHFLSWMTYLNNSGSGSTAPARPDAQAPCFSELLQAQADAFSAWTANQQSQPQAPETPASPTAPSPAPGSPQAARPPQGASLTIADMPPGFSEKRSERIDREGYTSYIATFAQDSLVADSSRGPLTVANIVITFAPDSVVTPQMAASILEDSVRDHITDNPSRTTGPSIGTTAQWFMGTMRSGNTTAEAHAVVFSTGRSAAMVATVALSGRGGQEGTVQYARIVAERLSGGSGGEIRTPATTESPTGAPTGSGRPSWVPSGGRYVPFGQTERIAVVEIVCRYRSIPADCTTAREPTQFADVTVVDVARNAEAEMRSNFRLVESFWERYRPEPGEEVVFVKLRVAYVDGPPGSDLLASTVNVLASRDNVLTNTGRPGRLFAGGLGVREPTLLNTIRLGRGVEGWIGMYVPAGAQVVLHGKAHPDETVYYATF